MTSSATRSLYFSLFWDPDGSPSLVRAPGVDRIDKAVADMVRREELEQDTSGATGELLHRAEPADKGVWYSSRSTPMIHNPHVITVYRIMLVLRVGSRAAHP
jgi:hypothetical protein